MRVEQLAGRAELSVDTVRYYQKLGLLHPPLKEGRVALYNESHAHRLEEIRNLSEEGFSLAQIQSLAASEPHPLLQSLNDATESLSLGDLVNASSLDEDMVRLAIDAGLIRPISPGNNRFASSTLPMLRAGADLLDAGVPLDQLIQLAIRHAEHVDNVAKAAVALFAEHWGGAPSTSQTAAVEDIVPLVTDLVAEHFRQTLIEQVSRHVLRGSDSP